MADTTDCLIKTMLCDACDVGTQDIKHHQLSSIDALLVAGLFKAIDRMSNNLERIEELLAELDAIDKVIQS